MRQTTDSDLIIELSLLLLRRNPPKLSISSPFPRSPSYHWCRTLTRCWWRGSGLWTRAPSCPGQWHCLQGVKDTQILSHYLSKLNPQHWGAVISAGWFLFSVLMGTLTVHNHLTDSACTGDHWPVQQRVSCGGQTEILPKWFTFIEVDSVRKGSFEWTVRTLECF